MARLESTSLSVSPKEEQSVIELHQKFGWELKSSQEIFNKDSHNERRGDSVYNVTETTNYVKLVFQRDKDMPYYKQICELENKYYSTIKSEPRNASSYAVTVLGIIIAVIGLLCALFGEVGVKIVGIAGIALAVLLIIKNVKKNNKLDAEYRENHDKWNNECTMLLAETENYI
mgnify:CR=1 FL=1